MARTLRSTTQIMDLIFNIQDDPFLYSLHVATPGCQMDLDCEDQGARLPTLRPTMGCVMVRPWGPQKDLAPSW